MGKEIFNFFISNQCVDYPDPDKKDRKKSLEADTVLHVAQNLKFLFDQICKKSPKFSDSAYYWEESLRANEQPVFLMTNIKPNELLIYLVPSRRSSLVLAQSDAELAKVTDPDEKKLLEERRKTTATEIRSHGGATLSLKCGILSEVFLEEGVLSLLDDVDRANKTADITARLLSYLIFHEWMHNKLDVLDKDKKDIHKVGGGGLAAETLDDVQKIAREDILTSRNVSLMAAALPLNRPQCKARLVSF
jgi:hypothetical protein